MPFLLCNTFLGFKNELTQALSSDESATEIDDSSSFTSISAEEFAFFVVIEGDLGLYVRNQGSRIELRGVSTRDL